MPRHAYKEQGPQTHCGNDARQLSVGKTDLFSPNLFVPTPVTAYEIRRNFWMVKETCKQGNALRNRSARRASSMAFGKTGDLPH